MVSKKKPDTGRLWVAVVIILLTAIAAVLRFWGLRWGLPDELHKYTYHPDEIFQIIAMLRLNPFAFELDPGFYNYPSGYMNLGAIALRVADAYGVEINESLTGVYLVARALTAALGITVVPVVYLAGAKLYGKAAGIIAALVIAIMPLHIVHSHFATVDVPTATWVALALLGAAAIVDRPRIGVYILAAGAAGVAAGTKYTALLVLIPVLAAHFLREDKIKFAKRLVDIKLWAAVVGFITGFLIATPGWLFMPEKFFAGLLYELRHSQTGHGMVFVGRGPGWFDVLANSLGYGLGIALLVFGLLAVAMAISRRKRSDWILLSFLVPYFLLISFSEVRFARYAIPLLPPIALLVGRMMADAYSVMKESGANSVIRWAWVATCVLIIGYTGAYAAAFDGLFSSKDPRTAGAEWFFESVESDTAVAFPTVPWFYSLPLAPEINGAVGAENRYESMSDSRYRLLTNPEKPWDLTLLEEEMPEYAVVSDFESEDLLRLRDPSVLKYLDYLGKHYSEYKTFRNDLTVLGISFGKAEQLPHDLKYMSPTIHVYRRK